MCTKKKLIHISQTNDMKNIYDCLFEKKLFGVELHCDAIVFDILILQIIDVHVVILCNIMKTYNYN